MAEPRIAPGSRSQVGWINRAIADAAGRISGTTPPNLFLTLGRHRKLFRAWLRFAGRMMPRGTLPRRETELVILRVAHLCDSAYEFEHHVRLGRRIGLGLEDIEAVTKPLGESSWPAREAAILGAVDRLHRDRDLDDASWLELRRHLDDVECIELLMLVGHYEMLATFLQTLRVSPDLARR
jgi:alkylhydroperoxidase family enzyme